MVLREGTICSGRTMRCGGWFCGSSSLTGLEGFCCAKLRMLNRNSMENKETVLRQVFIGREFFRVIQISAKKLVFGCGILGFFE